MSKPSNKILKPILKIKANPAKTARYYYFKISQTFIENGNIVPENTYYLFVTEQVNRDIFGRESSISSAPYNSKLFQPVLQIKGSPQKSHNAYYFKIGADYITYKDILPDVEYNLFITETFISNDWEGKEGCSDTIENEENKANSPDPFDISGLMDKSFTPVLRIITKPRKEGITYVFPIPMAFISNENILPHHHYIIYVTKSIQSK